MSKAPLVLGNEGAGTGETLRSIGRSYNVSAQTISRLGD
jgi:hypothetical protein